MHPTDTNPLENLLKTVLRAAQSAGRTVARCLRALILDVSDELAAEIERAAEAQAYAPKITEMSFYPVAVTDSDGVEHTSYRLSTPHPIDDVPYPWERGDTEGGQ